MNRDEADAHECADAALADLFAGTGVQPGAAPPQGVMLQFRSAPLERAYARGEYVRNRTLIATGCLVILAVTLLLYLLDPILVPASAVASFRLSRLCIGLPGAALLSACALRIRDPRWWARCCSVLFGVHAAQEYALLLLNGPTTFEYLSYGIWEAVVANFFLFGLTVRWLVPFNALVCAGFAVCAWIAGVGLLQFVNYFAVDAVIMYSFGLVGAYRYERAARRQFVAQALSRLAHARQLDVEAQRRRWLEVFAAFLRHEMKNAMVGISTSLELARRTGAADQAPAGLFFERAERSLGFMRRLLVQVADATSLESALSRQGFADVDFSRLLSDRIEDLGDQGGGGRLETQLAPGVVIVGNADALRQMMDKVVTNAFEHGHPDRPVRIELRREHERCIVEVSDSGDELPGDVEALFEPFVSHKRARGEGGNLGLGLFVARTIATHHGGSLQAERLDGAAGARFIISLPCMADAAAPHGAAVRTPASSDILDRAPS